MLYQQECVFDLMLRKAVHYLHSTPQETVLNYPIDIHFLLSTRLTKTCLLFNRKINTSK